MKLLYCSVISLAALLALSQGSFASVSKSVTISSFSSTGIVLLKGGCKREIKHDFLPNQIKDEDCYGILLEDVVAAESSGNQVQVGTVFLNPVSWDRTGAQIVSDAIQTALSHPEGGATFDLGLNLQNNSEIPDSYDDINPSGN